MSVKSCVLKMLAGGYREKTREQEDPFLFILIISWPWHSKLRSTGRETEGVEAYGTEESRHCQRLEVSTLTVMFELKGKEQDLSRFCDVCGPWLL